MTTHTLFLMLITGLNALVHGLKGVRWVKKKSDK